MYQSYYDEQRLASQQTVGVGKILVDDVPLKWENKSIVAP